MAEILKLDDYRSSGDTVDMDFIGFHFVTPEGETMRLTQTITVPSDHIERTIEQVREQGGIPMFDSDVAWFLPWPPAAIRLRDAAETPDPEPEVA